MKKVLVILFLIGLIGASFSNSPVLADKIQRPRSDTLDLYVNSARNISHQISFAVITNIVFHMSFTDASIDYSNWGSASALTNGFDLRLNISNFEYSLFDDVLIKSLADFGIYSFDWAFSIKTGGDNYFTVRYDFIQFTVSGLDNRTGQISELFFMIQDNMQTGINSLWATIEGYQITTTNYFVLPLKNFKPNFVYALQLEDLVIGTNYNLKVNTSEADGATLWINFTAQEDIEEIKFTWDPGNYDSNVINFYVYDVNTLVDQESTFVIYQDITTGMNSVIQFALMAGFLFVTIIFVFFMIDRGKGALRGFKVRFR
ncbi:MAG: hypothetical protein ACXAC2_09855 [Candidatus Kariarchaeaceae archaeon]|jgi:hypothetical protein